MTDIYVDLEVLRRMVGLLIHRGAEMPRWATTLVNRTDGARTYEGGQYGPWVRDVAAAAASRVRTFAEELADHGHWLRNVVKAFEEADGADVAGYGAWAAMIRTMVEDGQDPTSLIPDWARLRGCPPWISMEDWMMPNGDQRRAIVDEYLAAYQAQQARIERLRTPPWEKDADWLWRITGVDPNLLDSLGAASLDDLLSHQEDLARLRAKWQGYWDEFLESQSLYKFGVGDDLTESFLIYMFGLEGAAEYGVEDIVAADQRILGIPEFPFPGEAVEQYIDLGKIGAFEGNGYTVHPNLCGQLVVAATIGQDPEDALIEFNSLDPVKDGSVTTDGFAILGNPHQGTGAANLRDLLQEYGWQGDRVGNAGDPYPWYDGRSWEPKPGQVADHLAHGRAVIALVNLDTATQRIDAADGTDDATHWVSVLQIVETRTGESVARIYNPFQNREEWYSFDTLVDAWTPGPNYRAVIATPPQSLAWFPTP